MRCFPSTGNMRASKKDLVEILALVETRYDVMSILKVG